MLGLTEAEHVAVTGLLGVMLTAGTTLVGVIYQGHKTRRTTAEQLDTGNGHTAGEALSRLETVAWQHEQRLDAIDMKLGDQQEAHAEATQAHETTQAKVDQHLAESRPIRDWVVEQIEQQHMAEKEEPRV